MMGLKNYLNGPKSYTYKRQTKSAVEKIAITFDKMKQLALSVNDMPIEETMGFL